MAEPPAVPITDAERERMVLVLREHCTEGRLTLDEFSDRVGEVFEARTRDALHRAMRDLPAVAAPIPEERRRKITRWAVAVLGGHSERARWRPGDEVYAIAFMGGCDLDLRQAEIDGPEVVINAYAFMGGVDIVVPEGIAVEMSGFALMGGRDCRVKGRPIPGAPIVRVRAFALMGGVSVRSKPAHGVDEDGRALPPQPELTAAPGKGHREVHQRKREARDAARQIARQVRDDARRTGRHPRDIAIELAEDALRGAIDPSSRARRMPTAPDGTVTILFTDIEGYTAMTERLGDLEAQRVLNAHNVIIRDEIAQYDGFEVKSQGDGFMVAFASARKALNCATSIQRRIEKYSLEHPEQPLRVGMGLHTGEALLEDGDFTGRTVILAARIAAEAEGGEIAVSSVVKELTESVGEFDFVDEREVSLKGLTQPYRLYSLLW